MDVKSIVQEVVSEIETVGQATVTAFQAGVNVAELESIAGAAFLSGGASAVLPALAANVDKFVSDPTIALAVKLCLRLAQAA